MQVTDLSRGFSALEPAIPAQPGIQFMNDFDATLSSLIGWPIGAPRLAVAVSGGADSIALTLLADAWARARGGYVVALTVDHGLRAESRSEATQVAQWMRARGIEHRLLTPVHTEVSNNLQEAARQWRYDALADACRAEGILHCLLAHHAGDQRETIALHQARGDTVDGPSGMSAVRNYRGVRFVRPLLRTEKHALQQFLREVQCQWIEDPSNSNEDFARVRMRKKLENDTTLRATLDMQAAKHGAARSCATISAPGGDALCRHHRWVCRHGSRCLAGARTPREWSALADLLTTVSGAAHRPRASDTERLMHALRTTQRSHTLHGCEIKQNNGGIRIARELARVQDAQILAGRGQMVWDQRFNIYYDLAPGITLTLRAVGRAKGLGDLPPASPSLWHLDALAMLPHIPWQCSGLPAGARVTVGFAPAKPLAAAPFWWLKE